MDASHDYEPELKTAVEAARAAGREVMRLRQEGMRFGHKEDFELVSEADLRADEMLYEALHGAFPDTAWLSEETKDNADRLRSDRLWVVDPIDGTREFLQGIPEFAVSVGLVVDGQPVLGVVHNPAADETDAAICAGATETPDGEVPEPLEVLVSRNELRWRDIPPLPPGTRAMGIGSVAYRLALLARGTGHAALTGYGRAEWDVAAGVALCRAQGLRVTDVLGFPMTFNQEDPAIRGMLAARVSVHRAIQAHFRSVGVETA